MTSLLPSRFFHWNFKIDVISKSVSCSLSSTTTRTTWQRSTLRAGSATGSRELESRALGELVSCFAKHSVNLVKTFHSAPLLLTLHLLALALRVTSSSLPDLPLQVTIPSFRAEHKSQANLSGSWKQERDASQGCLELPWHHPSSTFSFHQFQS